MDSPAEVKGRQRVPPMHPLNLDGINEFKGDEGDGNGDHEACDSEYPSGSEYESDSEYESGSEDGNVPGAENGYASNFPVKSASPEKETRRGPLSPTDEWVPLSPNSQKLYENTNLMPRIRELHDNLDTPAKRAEHVGLKSDPADEMENYIETVQLLKRPYLKKGSGLSRFYGNSSQNRGTTKPEARPSSSPLLSAQKADLAPNKTISPPTKRPVSAPTQKAVPAQKQKDVPPLRQKNVVAQRQKVVPVQKQKDVAQRQKDVPAQRKKDVPDQRQKDVPVQRQKDAPVQRQKTFAAQIQKAVLAPAKRVVSVPSLKVRSSSADSSHSFEDIYFTKNCDLEVASLSKNCEFSSKSSQSSSVTQTASFSSETESDCEQNPELHLFELMETISANPNFSEFSELAQKFVNQEGVNKDLLEELKVLNRQLIEEKTNLEVRNKDLVKEKLDLLKVIEDLVLDKDHAYKENQIIIRKGMLDLRNEKELREKYKQKYLQATEELMAGKKALQNENQKLISDKMGLLTLNKRLATEKLHLLTEKEQWSNEKNAMLAHQQEWRLEKQQLLKEKDDWLAEKRNLIARYQASPGVTKPSNETRLPNGDIEFNLDNGTKKYVNKDGREYKFSYINGDIKEIGPDGTIEYFYGSANIWHISKPDGIIIMKFPNGQVETVESDGTKTVVYPNKIVRKIRPDGTEKYVYPDNTIAVTEPNGVKCFTFPNGEKEYVHDKFTKRVYPGGTVKTLFEDGSLETKWASGRVRTKDPDGNVIYDTGEPPVPKFLREIKKYNDL